MELWRISTGFRQVEDLGKEEKGDRNSSLEQNEQHLTRGDVFFIAYQNNPVSKKVKNIWVKDKLL